MSRVVVAMSGGVDSSVAAALAVRRGHRALGVTLRLVPGPETGFGCCGSPRDVEDAKRVCERLGMPHYVVDMAELFERRVISPFVDGYLNRRTPNPCVECNRSVKFGHLLRLAEAWGAERVATGHYARVEGGRLLRAEDPEKDQSYFLYTLTRAELGRVLFPVGGLRKVEARRLARELGLETADKPESQEICFVPGGDYRGFLRSRSPSGALGPEGDIRDAQGRALGRHQGLGNYTIGQRKGLGAVRRGEARSSPFYVTRMDADSNVLYVGPDSETLRPGLRASGVSWTSAPPPDGARVEARIRHRHVPAPSRLRLDGSVGRARVEFDSPQRAVTPGQAVVFYRGEEVLGGGTIEEAL